MGNLQCQSHYDQDNSNQVDLRVVTMVSPNKLVKFSEGSVKSEENIKYAVSNHSVQQKIRDNSTSSKINLKSVSSHCGRGSSGSHDLDEMVGSIVFKTKYDIETKQDSLSIDQSMDNLIVPVTLMPFRWLRSFSCGPIVDNLNPNLPSELQIEDYDNSRLINMAEESEDQQTIHLRKIYGQFGEVEREVKVKRIKMGEQEYALKQDKKMFFTKQDDQTLKVQIQADCKRFSNWFEISKIRPKNVLQVTAAQVLFDNQSTLTTKSLTPFHEGQTLNTFLLTTTINDQQIICIADQIVEALHFIHTKGFVHGDVKPHNFLCHTIQNNGFLLTLIDMDSLSLDREITDIDSTVLYRAVDVFITPSYEADIWALGLTLYSLVSSQKIIINWGYHEYRQRDQQLPQYVDGYGVLDEVLMLCLSRQHYKERNLINIKTLIKQQINL